MNLAVINLENEKVGDVKLDIDFTEIVVRPDILHRVSEWNRANKRRGTHKTKDISEVSGTGKKPYAQKGTGRARQGSLRSPQFRGGAVIFGPVVRDHSYKLQKKVRKLGLKMALTSRLGENKLYIVDSFALENPKTKVLANKLDKFQFGKALFIDENKDCQNFRKSLANIKNVDFLPEIGANVYDILAHDSIFITKTAMLKLVQRLK